MNYLNLIKNGIIKDNPTFVLLLGMCPTLATTTSATNGMSMGLATMFVLICSNVVVSLIKNLTPDKVRIPVFVVVIASFVTLLQMSLKAYLPEINKSLGLFIPLIVVNCIILGRAEAFACKNGPVGSFFDGVGIGLGFTLGLTLLGAVRELFGAGSLFGLLLLPETTNILLFILPPGAFITLGFLIAIVNRFKIHISNFCEQHSVVTIPWYLPVLGCIQKSGNSIGYECCRGIRNDFGNHRDLCVAEVCA